MNTEETNFTVWLQLDKDEKKFCGSFPNEEEAKAHVEYLKPSLYKWEELIIEPH